ncbi:aldehyde dehydrogenase family protein [Mucilaginibacter sp. X4EP1]|uniref:aldehyde dehydrogenase family protein n=1 Tax=Mucilaginibacter sp. X4EP1 TaxID=2723092 RepID=UPI002168F593|nr:aldehyde dehydrogenase family protein [Mucilaginibacter sp. X4EP1]MCS3812009.1 aldehyde dehydrogenase (NAD+) [Mucilaginibacter sp. X4EP1]
MENQFQKVFDKQKAYFLSDVTKTYEWRIDQLTRLSKMLGENAGAFIEALGLDFKTAPFEREQEILVCLGCIEETKGHLREWMKPESLKLPKRMIETGHRALLYREPYGTTLIIGPFNAPIVLLLVPLINALSAGNNAIVKPSESVSHVAAAFTKFFPQYFEEEAVAVVNGGKEEVTQLLQLPFDFMFFTGSTNVGKVVMRAAAERLTPVLLELGGQNAVLVDKTANLKEAARKITWGATAMSGQWCVSPGYVYVDESVADEFAEECKAALHEMYGDDASKSPDYSRIISQKDVNRLAGVLVDGKVIYGGRYDVEQRYFEPTLVYPATWEDKVMQEEIFGPILPILKYKDVREAIAVIKSKPRGLAGYIYSQDQQLIDTFINSVSFGGGCVNQNNVQVFFTDGVPFGGVGTAGVGKYYGKYGFDSLTNAKTIIVSPSDQTVNDFLPPYTDEKKNDFGSWFVPA